MNNKVKEFIESAPTWVEEEMERLDKYWKEETIKWLKENHDIGMIIWEQSSSTRENYKPMQSELENKEEIIKKQIEVIKELNSAIEDGKRYVDIIEETNKKLYENIEQLEEDLKSQDIGIKALIQDWKELKEDCATQTNEVQRLNDKIKLMEDMNNELQLENLILKNKFEIIS